MKKSIFLFALLICTIAVFARRIYIPTSLVYKVHQPIVASKNPPVLFLLHGYGSNEDDLFSLAAQLPPNLLIVSVRAPYKIEKGSYKWYDFDFNSPTKEVSLWHLQESTNALINLLDTIQQKYHYNKSKVYFGGFSQGGIMSYHLAFTHPKLVKGIIVMSGRLLPETKSQIQDVKAIQKLKIIIVHGTEDPVINIQEARNAKDYLNEKKIPFTYQEYKMVHTISDEEMVLINDCLKKN
jgi:phospholipase/carboxylesterase